MSAAKTGVTFMLGAMFGSFVTRGVLHRRYHDDKTGEGRPCPRHAKPNKSTPSPEMEATTTTMPMAVHS